LCLIKFDFESAQSVLRANCTRQISASYVERSKATQGKITRWTGRKNGQTPRARSEAKRTRCNKRHVGATLGRALEWNWKRKACRGTGGECLDASRMVYVCRCKCGDGTRRPERPEESVSQSLSRSRRVALDCAARSRGRLAYSFLFFLFFFFQISSILCGVLTWWRENLTGRARRFHQRDYSAVEAECRVISERSEEKKVRIFCLFISIKENFVRRGSCKTRIRSWSESNSIFPKLYKVVSKIDS